ncbi:hypothetical protein [Fulvivirga lutimaris]|uniref:hypothetical protein n=1 Tax=Fulvivirga lutimaris TaxID=1819566 RepID=UPI0012BCB88D|nr:hypothetical protein [Fulvivirga lutimaris]MTI40133.1 hypothetical protein [Fulvivirga lutimaris]
MTFNQDEELIAKCYLDKEGDNNNISYLTSTSLHVTINSKTYSFFNYWIKNIGFKQKKFLIPIVLGGIAGPLAALGLFQYYLNHWVMLSIMMAAVFSIYYGIEGGLALCIETPIKEYDLFLKKTTPQLKAFIAFVSSSLSGNEIGFYFKISIQDWNKANELDFYEPPSSGIMLSNSKPLKEDRHVILEILPKELTFEIKYELEQNDKLVPMVYEKIPLGQIKKIG